VITLRQVVEPAVDTAPHAPQAPDAPHAPRTGSLPGMYEDRAPPTHTVVPSLVLGALRAYQAARAGHVSPCRFYPSCSAYAVEAVERHGARRGVWLAVRRVARCHPLGGHGVDLVPLETGRRGRERE